MEEPVDVAVKPPCPGPEHLGDGVYVAFDGYHLTFSVNDHRAYPVVFMEYGVYKQLREYAKRLGWDK